jgi:hypothetical protein
MIRRNLARAASLAAILCALPTAHAFEQNSPPSGFVALFNGKDLSGWHGMPHFDPRKLDAMSEEDRAKQIAAWTEDAKAHWSVEGGDLVTDAKGAYLATDQSYGDIELRIDYKTVPKADSGIYLRATPQVQIWDFTEAGGKWNLGADKGSGGLWNNSKGAPGKDPLILADKPFGEWNQFRIIQVGARTTVYLNDTLVVDHATMENFWDRSSPLLARGPIQLQTHGGEIRWRNIFVREIPADEANTILSQHGTKGFTSIFDGKDLEGWAGPVDNYEVVDGAIRCKPGKGRRALLQQGVLRLHGPGRVPPAAGRQQRTRHPLPGRGRHVGHRHVRAPDPRRCEPALYEDRPPPGARLGLRDGPGQTGLPPAGR